MVKAYHKNALSQAATTRYKVLYESGATTDKSQNDAHIRLLINSILDRGNEGHPKMLKGKSHPIDGLKLFSRAVTLEDRLVYSYDHAQRTVIIRQMEGHYDD